MIHTVQNFLGESLLPKESVPGISTPACDYGEAQNTPNHLLVVLCADGHSQGLGRLALAKLHRISHKHLFESGHGLKTRQGQCQKPVGYTVQPF